MNQVRSKRIEFIFTIIFIFAGIYAVVFFLGTYVLKIGGVYEEIVNASLSAIVIYLVASEIKKFLTLKSNIKGNIHKIVFVNYIINTLVYFIIFLVVLSFFKINVDSLITGSIFLAAIIGLAGQSVIGNILGGLIMEISKPLRPGQYVWIFPWSSSSALMSLQMAVFSQKYYSKDILYAQGIRGKVMDITLNFVKLETDEGSVTSVPNVLVALGAFQIGPQSGSFSLRYEVPKNVEPDVIRKTVNEVLKTMNISDSTYIFTVDETTLNTYLIDIRFPFLSDSGTRTGIINKLAERLEPMRIINLKP